jgi:hypothetical protein
MRALLIAAVLLPGAIAAQSGPIGRDPLVTIPATSPDGEVLLERITDADLLPDGGVVVADGPANTLLFFDAAGRLVARAGGTGDGPGEFRQLWGVEVCGGTVVAHELIATSLQRYTSRGEDRGRLTLANPVTAMTPLRCGPGGGYVGMIDARPAGRPQPGSVTVAFSASVALFDTLGGLVARAKVDSALEMVMLGGGGAPSSLGPMLSLASTRELVVFGSGSEPAIRVMNRSGAVGRAPLSLQAVRVTPADRARGREAWLELVPAAMRDALALQYDRIPDPTHLPYYRRLLPTSQGVVLLEVSGPGALRQRWRPTDGLSLGSPFDLPVAGQLVAVSTDRALILITDEDGEQALQVHGVRGPGAIFVMPPRAPPL